MRKSFANFASPFLVLAFAHSGLATGGFSPGRWLENGGKASAMSPEFFWDLELRRLARQFQPPEKRVLPPESNPDKEGEPSPLARFTAMTEVREFDEAIQSKRIAPSDPVQARAQHLAARDQVAASKADSPGAAQGEEFASEFSDYHQGARAFREKRYGAAQAAWEGLLRRPEKERHYRTVWATFMLGKVALEQKDAGAVGFFQKTRVLAMEGFADGLGLAADSYGWEARAELRQGHLEKAAQLYLTQLALGDASAIISLKAVIPDRPAVYGMLNYGEQAPETLSFEQQKEWEKKREPEVRRQLEAAAQSPLLRRLITAHVLATETSLALWGYGSDESEASSPQRKRCLNWLAVVEKLPGQLLEDADHLGWVAYTAGRYEEAARWLKVAAPDSATSLWLRSKLERRAGKLNDAAQSMAAAWRLIRGDTASLTDHTESWNGADEGYIPTQSAAGDLAGLHLTRGEFQTAMEVFIQGNLWEDAAYVGDRVLTVEELKKAVDESWPERPEENPGAEAEGSYRRRMRWMLARRLVREDQAEAARPYFPKEQQPVLDRYVAALKKADDSRAPKQERARALFDAGWIARYSGMELMGAEVEPDGASRNGLFPPGNLDLERGEGMQLVDKFDAKGKAWTEKKPLELFVAVSKEEKLRLKKSQPLPNARFHYRHVAAGLAWKASALLPDGSEELADVLNTGGSWIKDRDEKGAERFFQALERRCVKTKIGRAAHTRHWFVSMEGAWSGSNQRPSEN